MWLVVLMVPKPSGKKRKPSAYKDKDKERPVPHPSQDHQSRLSTDSNAENQWQSQPVSPPEKRQRMFEVSDTRTPSNEDEPAQDSQAYYSMYPMTMPIMSQAPHQLTGPMPTYDMVFDLGGVTFDGLELLQGVNGDASNFWNNFNFGMDVAGYGIISGRLRTSKKGKTTIPSFW